MPDRPAPCPCGHDLHGVPRDQRMALALARHRYAIESLLTVVARDPSRYLGVLRCVRCGRFWAEDCLSSGHADLFYLYPLQTGDPYAWLAQARPLDLASG